MGPFVHRDLTRDWALEAGFSDHEAELIAQANVAVDRENPARRGISEASRHFRPTAPLWARYHLRAAQRHHDLHELGRALHSAQDAVAHGWLGLAHIRLRLRLIGRHPDVWETAPDGVRRSIERWSREILAAYHDAAG